MADTLNISCDVSNERTFVYLHFDIYRFELFPRFRPSLTDNMPNILYVHRTFFCFSRCQESPFDVCYIN